MKYEIYYLNGAGKKLDFTQIPYLMETGDLLDFEWQYNSTTNHNSFGGKISDFTKSITSKTINMSVFAWSEAAYKTALNDLIDAIEYDLIRLKPGKLYLNGNYLRCYITAGKFEDWESPIDFLNLELTITTEYPMWITEREWNFTPGAATVKNAKRYPGRYPYRYASGAASGIINQPSNSPAHFQLVMHGPVADPQCQIAGKTYGVVDTVLGDDEYVVIDSDKNTVTLFCSDGTTQNIYNKRTRGNSVFERLPSGVLDVHWAGGFLLSIVVFEERSVPRWSLSQSERTASLAR